MASGPANFGTIVSPHVSINPPSSTALMNLNVSTAVLGGASFPECSGIQKVVVTAESSLKAPIIGFDDVVLDNNEGVKDVSSFFAPFLGNARSFSGHAQVDQMCSFTAPINYVFNIGGINCDLNVSFSDILGSLAKIAYQGNVPNAIQVCFFFCAFFAFEFLYYNVCFVFPIIFYFSITLIFRIKGGEDLLDDSLLDALIIGFR